MNKTKLTKLLGLAAAVFTAAATAVSGDYVTAIGIVSAALSSATIFQR